MKSIQKFRIWPPTRLFAQLEFSMGGSVTTTTTVGEIFIAANNPNDPGQTLSALQPTWYDQIQAFYNRYRVWGCKIQASFHNTTALVPYIVAIYPTRSSTGVTTIIDSVAQPHCKYREGGGATGNDAARISHFCASSTMFGTPINMSTDYSGGANGNPGLIWYWVVATQAYDATTAVTVADEIKLTMFIELYDKASVDMSTLAIRLEERLKTRAKRRQFKLDFRPDLDSKESSFEICSLSRD